MSLAVAAGPDARAAELSVDAPPACVDPATLAEEVGDLIGRPLAEVAGVDFRVRIAEMSPQKWRLQLETLDGQGAAGAPTVRGSREIDGAGCAELAEAASVAIAVSVRSIEAARSAPPPAAAVRPSPPIPPPGSPAATPSVALATRAPPRAVWRPSVTLAFAFDAGALPSASPGLELEGDLQRQALRLVLLATWFTSQDTVGPGGVGGTFQLALGGGLACYAPRWRRWTALACGGGELGPLAGTGNVAHPETGAVLWRAVRAEAGATVAVGPNTAILLRAALVRPLVRPDFVLDESQLVYRPSAVTVRLTAGLELGF
ncbi:MAG TPA: hypothetical protein VGP64_02790 [Polyangia bacterium]